MRRRHSVSESSWLSRCFGKLVEIAGALAFATFLYVSIARLSHRSDFLIPGEELHTAVAAGLTGCVLALLLLPAFLSGWSQTVRSFALFTAVGLVVVLCAVRTGTLKDPATTPLPDLLRGLERLCPTIPSCPKRIAAARKSTQSPMRWKGRLVVARRESK